MVWPSAFEGGGFLSSYARLFSMSIIPAAPAGVRLQAFDLTGASHQLKLPWQLVLTNRRLEKSLPQGDSGPDGVLLRSWFVHINRFVCVCVCVCVCVFARARIFFCLLKRQSAALGRTECYTARVTVAPILVLRPWP